MYRYRKCELLHFFQHAPGVPKVLIGNRLHLEFKRQVNMRDAEQYAVKNHMAFFEVSSLCNFNIRESFCELSRRALYRNGMERLLRSNKGIFHTPFVSSSNWMAYFLFILFYLTVLSLQELCCRTIVSRTTVYGIDQLPLPDSIKSYLKSYALTSLSSLTMTLPRNSNSKKGSRHGSSGQIRNVLIHTSSPQNVQSDTHCTGRNSCEISWRW